MKDLNWVDNENVMQVFSPDQKYQVVFSHFHEIRMGVYECLFNLLDNNEKIIDRFEPLTAISSNDCCWAENSACFSLAVRVEENYGYLFIHLPSLEFAFIKIFNPYPLDISFDSDNFIITYNDEQVKAANTNKLFGGGSNTLPYKKYIKPNDLVFKLSDLQFFKRDKMKNLNSIIESYKEYKHELNDGGFNEFKGVFPQDTITGYNGRSFEVYQLEAFAEYGDKVSKLWLDEIKNKTFGTYNKWNKVSDYISFRKRQDYENKS